MARNAARPLSPHLSIWRWGPHMLVSILHRATGSALAIGGGILFTWWLAAAASGPDTYGRFYAWTVAAQPEQPAQHLVNVLARLVGIGLSWAFFQHLCSGVRHLVLDIGAGYELKRNKQAAVATIACSAALTALMWGYIFAGNV